MLYSSRWESLKSWKAWMCRFLTRKYPCCSVWFSSRGQYCPHLTRPRSTTLGQEEGVRLGSPSSPPSHKTRGCQESHLVVMTMSSTICSQTSRQKSSKVLGKGPASQETTFCFFELLDSSGLFSLRSFQERCSNRPMYHICLFTQGNIGKTRVPTHPEWQCRHCFSCTHP